MFLYNVIALSICLLIHFDIVFQLTLGESELLEGRVYISFPSVSPASSTLCCSIRDVHPHADNGRDGGYWRSSV